MRFLKLSKYVYIAAGAIFSFMVVILIVLGTMKIEKSKSMVLEVKSLNKIVLKTDAATANLLDKHRDIIINLDGENIHAHITSGRKEKDFYILFVSGIEDKLIPDTTVRVSVIYDETTLLNNLLGL